MPLLLGTAGARHSTFLMSLQSSVLITVMLTGDEPVVTLVGLDVTVHTAV